MAPTDKITEQLEDTVQDTHLLFEMMPIAFRNPVVVAHKEDWYAGAGPMKRDRAFMNRLTKRRNKKKAAKARRTR